MNDYSKSAVVARRALLTTTTLGEPADPSLTAPPVSGINEQVMDQRQVSLPSTPVEVMRDLRPVKGQRVPKEVLEQRITDRLTTVHNYLTPTVLLSKLEDSKLKDIGVYEGILLTHLSHLRGHGQQPAMDGDNRKLSELMPVLLTELRQRGLTAKLTERTAEIVAK